jgi:hypothetical protein
MSKHIFIKESIKLKLTLTPQKMASHNKKMVAPHQKMTLRY